MTPKEKAKGLTDDMWLKIAVRHTPINVKIEHLKNKTDDKSIAKHCSIVAVDEILECMPLKPSNEREDYEVSIEDAVKFWQQVKTEIENL